MDESESADGQPEAPTPRSGRSGTFAEVYVELRRLAQGYLRQERPDHTLAPTALVHEAYLRLGHLHTADRGDRAAFLATAARAMRRILVEHARARRRLKRGGPRNAARRRLGLEAVDLGRLEADPDEFLAVDAAIRRLEQLDEHLAQLVRLRFFAGLTESEAAGVLGVSQRTLRRDWATAKAWLRRELAKGERE